MPLLEEASRKTDEARRTEKEIQELRQEVATRDAQIRALEQKADSAALRDDRYRTVIMNLQVQLQDRVRTIRELEEKLKNLVQIDLHPRF
jgi:chromosome segregation ATPase